MTFYHKDNEISTKIHLVDRNERKRGDLSLFWIIEDAICFQDHIQTTSSKIYLLIRVYTNKRKFTAMMKSLMGLSIQTQTEQKICYQECVDRIR